MISLTIFQYFPRDHAFPKFYTVLSLLIPQNLNDKRSYQSLAPGTVPRCLVPAPCFLYQISNLNTLDCKKNTFPYVYPVHNC